MKESPKVFLRFLRVCSLCVAFSLLLSSYRGYGQQAESLLERGIGAIPPAADMDSGVVVEYAYRFFEMRNGLPGVEWHFRWYPGKLDGDRADAVFTENTAFTKVLRSPPVLTWDVHVREATGRSRFVGTFSGVHVHMPFRIFAVSVGDPTACEDRNRFLAGHQVLTVTSCRPSCRCNDDDWADLPKVPIANTTPRRGRLQWAGWIRLTERPAALPLDRLAVAPGREGLQAGPAA